MNTAITRASVLLCLFAVGCGSAAVRDRASIPRHRWTDADWYAQAIEDGVRSYESEVASATALSYGSPAEAEAVATTLRGARFEAHLATALQRYGLTLRGLDVHDARHPGFIDAQAALHRTRIERASERLADLGRTATADVTVVEFDVPTDAPATQVASR